MTELHLMEFSIGTTHTISTGKPYENIKVEGRITCGFKRGGTDLEFKETMQLAQKRLREILEETYRYQMRNRQVSEEFTR